MQPDPRWSAESESRSGWPPSPVPPSGRLQSLHLSSPLDLKIFLLRRLFRTLKADCVADVTIARWAFCSADVKTVALSNLAVPRSFRPSTSHCLLDNLYLLVSYAVFFRFLSSVLCNTIHHPFDYQHLVTTLRCAHVRSAHAFASSFSTAHIQSACIPDCHPKSGTIQLGDTGPRPRYPDVDINSPKGLVEGSVQNPALSLLSWCERLSSLTH